MATVYISEYAQAADADGKPLQITTEPPIAEQPKTVSTSSVGLDTAYNTSTRYVCIISDAKIHVNFNGTATTNNKYIPADTRMCFAVIPTHAPQFIGLV